MKNHVLRCLLAAMVLAGALHPRADAQCRPGYGGPATVTWNGFVFTSRNPPCVSNVTVTYCYSGPNIMPMMYDILSVATDPPCPGAPPIDGAMMRAIGMALVQSDKAAGFPCPQCPSVDVQFGVQWAACVRPIVQPSGGTQFVACPNAEGACMDFYTVCCHPDGTRTVSFFAHTPTADCTDPSCFPVCPP